ncbi:hypothetical protein [Faecalibacter sp. LW9]|uniref:hypothetical protein n=1 Tax=Faecalibacter sp. LW9 TaxID=3103144 RepID=UPI002AFE8CAF|nr:hypothetical protein [Faecalibacter sp. LW9]
MCIFSLYEIYTFRGNNEVINNNNKKEITVREKNCGSHNGAFSISFLHKEKEYYTKLNGETCLNLNIGDKYEVFYSIKNDNFLDKPSVEHRKKRVMVSIF